MIDLRNATVPGTALATTTRGFTSHEHFDAIGLVHMNGRVYDPNLGRFIQSDPIDDRGIQGLNRYSYVLNNPLSLTDCWRSLKIDHLLPEMRVEN